jgi:glycosyltransferase involved in cell wall biosynthesis
MKVAHIGSNSVHVRHFVAALQTQDVTNILVAEETCLFEGIEKELVISYRKLSPRILRKNKDLIKTYFLAEKPDVLHIHQLNRLAFFVSNIAKSLHIPVVSTAWGSDVLLIPKKNFFFRYLTKKTIKNSRIVTADAEVMIEAMKHLVPHGVEYKKVQYGIDPVQSNETKEKILFSNRLHKPLYRIDQIVHYFAGTRKAFPDYKLVIGASGDETENLKTLVKQYEMEDSVEFVGWLTSNQNKNWYAKSEFYVSIPSSDGTSVSLLEAISACCIPIVSDLPANKEWVTDKENGVIERLGENPLLTALSGNFGDSCKANAGKVNNIASRESTIPQFISYYEQSVNNK